MFKSTCGHSPAKANKSSETRAAEIFPMPPDFLQRMAFSQEAVKFLSTSLNLDRRSQTRAQAEGHSSDRRLFSQSGASCRLIPGLNDQVFTNASRCGVFRRKTRGSRFLFEDCWGVFTRKRNFIRHRLC